MAGSALSSFDLLPVLNATARHSRIDVEPANRVAAMDIIQRVIPSTNERLPVIGIGTWQTFDIGADTKRLASRTELLSAFVSQGGKLVDSSPMYGSSEKVIGDISAKCGLRQKLFVATKVWIAGKAAGIRQMNESLAKLRADPIDLLQVHNLVDVETQLQTLRHWKTAGRVRYVGVTHYLNEHHDAMAKIISSHPIDFVQINYSAAEREAEAKLFPLCVERQIAVIVNRPFIAGKLLRQLQKQRLPEFAAELRCTTWAQLLLKFVISHPAVTCVIPATSDVIHLRENMQAATLPLPDEALRARIAASIR